MLSSFRRGLTVGAFIACLTPRLSHADGGDFSVSLGYAPGLSAVTARDAPYRRDGFTYGFAHATKADVGYALSHHVMVFLGSEFSWPQAWRADNVNFMAKDGTSFQARRRQLRLLGGLALRSDRKQLWDLGLTLFTGGEWVQWSSGVASVQRGARSYSWSEQKLRGDKAVFFGLGPSSYWRLHSHITAEAGFRLRVRPHGSLGADGFVALRFSVPVGPSL